MKYTPKEMMVIAAARKIKNFDIVFCGTGISILAAMAAKHINAPQSIIFFETGAVDSALEELPLAVSDPRVMYNASTYCSLAETFAFMQNRNTGKNIIGILGAAQIDKYGNLNSTCIGDYRKPEVRFPGSGGACDVASFVGRTIVFMKLEKRKFVKKVDYITSPGWLSYPDERKKTGLIAGGPTCVVTDMGIMGFDKNSKKMYLTYFYPGIDPSEIKKNIGFNIDILRAKELEPPLRTELEALREKSDPERLILE
jgi:glutaconate CoA-transferase subunit B